MLKSATTTPPEAGAGREMRGELVTMMLAGQYVGIPVVTVQDILGAQHLTPVPLAAAEVAGVLNLRGRIVTAIDLRRRLGIAGTTSYAAAMNVVIEHQSELYSLLVDEVGDVLEPPAERFNRDLAVLKPAWRDVAEGIYTLEDRLLVVLAVDRVLSFATLG